MLVWPCKQTRLFPLLMSIVGGVDAFPSFFLFFIFSLSMKMTLWLPNIITSRSRRALQNEITCIF